ncbi:uncharacterized protein LOC126997736 [Eriocheir sinensis]|uniref:uncharacterized protein LOC126997736 n=1 Tax=Eriocheir sinensis TaxID=95602 RepID=UPI0021C6C134|nr:uncharacterized protein LOC126997736 [Eriocheir sinensis]
MIHLLHTGAVPFGCVKDTYFCCDEDCLSTVMDHRRPGTEPCQLPDVVLSNTPPPSPGHQACGCCGAHPCKARTQRRPIYSCSAPRNTPEDAPKGVTKEKAAKAASTEAHDIPVQSYLPQLCGLPLQSIVAAGAPAPADTPGGGHGRAGERDQWRHIGRDLRKVADHFQLHTSKKWRKNKPPLSPALPASVCRCVVASLVCLAWWRLYSKFY